MRGCLARAVLCLGLIGSGATRAENLSGADLMRALSGNTLTGFNGSLWFSEWHGPDGRVLGHNAGVKNQDSCWTVRGDAVCYYYPRNRTNEQDGRTEFCWHLEQKAGEEAYRIRPAGRPGGGFARLEPGNPRNHTDNGKSWTCDALISRRDPGDAVASVVAGGGMPKRVRQTLTAARSASPTSPAPLP